MLKKLSCLLVLACGVFNPTFANGSKAWQLGPFIRAEEVNPVISPNSESTFFCPVQKKIVKWESCHTFNPAAVAFNGKVYLLYRAEDDYGQSIGGHTSRLGLAVSEDGFHFKREKEPVIFPDNDSQLSYEWPGGCEDPRIVQKENGTFVMTYTQWSFNRNIPGEPSNIYVLGIATSKDLKVWKKHGYAFAKSKLGLIRSKSGSIICKQIGDSLVATKINGYYWMYWGDGPIYTAVSKDLISWEPIVDINNDLFIALDKRPGKFDSRLVEPGPPAVLTNDGIVLLYNCCNSMEGGDPTLAPHMYTTGQALFHSKNPRKLLKRTDNYFMKPERNYEINGQYKEGTVFIEGLVPFKGKWFLYYGTADSSIGVAVSQKL